MSFLDWFRRRPVAEQKRSPIMDIPHPGITPRFSPREYKSFAKEAYQRNPIAFRAIDLKAKSLGSVRWFHQGTNKEGDAYEIENSTLVKLLEKPHQGTAQTMFLAQVVTYLDIAGEVFIVKVRDGADGRGKVRELHLIRPDRMEIINRGIEVTGYAYNATGQRSKTWTRDVVTGKCDVLHLKFFNPLDDFRGMSPLETIMYEVDTYNEQAKWNLSLLQNGYKSSGDFETEHNLSPEQRQAMREDINSMTGPGEANKPRLLEGGVKFVPRVMTPLDMDYLNGRYAAARATCLGLAVPPQLLGIPGDNTYSNYQEAREAFFEETIWFYLEMLRGEFNNWLLSDYPEYAGTTLEYDLDSVAAMERKRAVRWQRAAAPFLTINEQREMVGYEATDGGDEVLVNATVVPLSFVSDAADAGVSDAEAEKSRTDFERRLLADGYTPERIKAISNLAYDA